MGRWKGSGKIHIVRNTEQLVEEVEKILCILPRNFPATLGFYAAALRIAIDWEAVSLAVGHGGGGGLCFGEVRPGLAMLATPCFLVGSGIPAF